MSCLTLRLNFVGIREWFVVCRRLLLPLNWLLHSPSTVTLFFRRRECVYSRENDDDGETKVSPYYSCAWFLHSIYNYNHEKDLLRRLPSSWWSCSWRSRRWRLGWNWTHDSSRIWLFFVSLLVGPTQERMKERKSTWCMQVGRYYYPCLRSWISCLFSYALVMGRIHHDIKDGENETWKRSPLSQSFLSRQSVCWSCFVRWSWSCTLFVFWCTHLTWGFLASRMRNEFLLSLSLVQDKDGLSLILTKEVSTTDWTRVRNK